MFCCFRPPATQGDGQSTAAGAGAAAAGAAKPGDADAEVPPAAVRRRSGSTDRARQQPQQPQQQHLGQIPLDPFAQLGEGAAQQAPGLQPGTHPYDTHEAAAGQQHHAQQQQQQQAPRASDDAGAAPQNDVLQLVALLQELLGLSTASPRQPLSKAMGLLVVRLPVDWACLHAFSASGRVVMQVGAALSPEAQRQRGASGSCSYATPVGGASVRQRLSYTNMLNTTGSSSNSATAGSGAAGTSAGVQEVGAGHLAVLPGSGSSLELVSGSRQALAMYAGDEGEARGLPPDWQRLYADRDLRSFLVVPIIASGSAGSVIGALSFGLTSITDWGLAWWMSSIQLLCGWAAGALPQNRATARATFFDALWSASDLQDVGRVFVSQLPAAMADQAQHRLEARLALVSSRVASCVMFAGPPDGRTSQEQQQAAGPPAQPAAPPLQQQKQQQQQQGLPDSQQQQVQPSSSAGGGQVVPEGMILTAADESGVWAGQQAGGSAKGSTLSNARGQDGGSQVQQQQQQEQEQDTQLNGVHSAAVEAVSRFTLPTANSVLLSALEWGEVMVVKDTVTYFGRNAAGGSSAVRDLFLPDRPMVRGTLVLLPLVYRCRSVGCVYLLAPWDIHAQLGKAALQEMAALLAVGTFKALLRGGHVQRDWYAQVLSEGPMPSVPEFDSSSSNAAAAAALTAAQPSGTLVGQEMAAAAAAAVAAGAPAAESEASRSKSPTGDTGWESGDVPAMGATGSCESMDPSTVSGAGAPAGGTTLSNGSNVVSCPLPLSTAEAVIAAAAAAQSAAAAAAAIAPVGLPVSGHAAAGFPDLVLWPELLDIKADLARSRHTAVYNAEYGGHLLAVKLFRYSTAMDHAGGSHPSQLHAGAAGGGGAAAAGISSLLGHSGPGGSSSGGNWASEAELEAVLSLQYRLCNMSHVHLLQQVAVYPRVYEVVQRRSSREPPDVYLAAVMPRKERHHRCAALVTEHAAGGCLRDAVSRGLVHVPTATALAAAATALGWEVPVDIASLSSSQLQELMAHIGQQLPVLAQPTVMRTSQEYAAAAAGAAAAAKQQQASTAAAAAAVSAPLPPAGRVSQELQHLREPHLPLLRQLLLHIALGMQHLHAHGIIHGELRLDNVMISGALPKTVALVKQQQGAATAATTAAAAGATPPNGAAAAAAPVTGELVGRSSSSGTGTGNYSTGGLHEGHLGSSSSGAHVLAGTSIALSSPAAVATASAAVADSSSGAGFVLKLKDIGLCTLGVSNRQCVLRKLAGRPRLQAVSWLAPECFRGEGLSKFSDVYAFGILMWELYTGQVAFDDLVTSNTKVLQTIIGDGVRPQFPDAAPAWYVNLATRCWAGAPKSRPSFRRIVQALQSVEEPPAAAGATPTTTVAAAAAAAAAQG